MFPFQILKRRIIYENKKIHKERITLQVHPLNIKNCIYERETSFFASFTNHKAYAFFTLEAALILPVFVCVICAFFWFFSVFKVQMELQKALREVSLELSESAFLYEEIRNLSNEGTEYVKLQDLGIERWIAGAVTEQYVENEIRKQVGEDNEIWNCIIRKERGIELKSFLRIPDENGIIDLILVYSMKNPFLPKVFGETEYIQRSRVRAWTGYCYKEKGEEEEQSKKVYITEHGRVYHLRRDCSYLDISVTGIPYISIPVMYSGRIYTECGVCSWKNTETVYITETGERFHWSLSCGSLRRTVYEVTMDEAAGYLPCSRCGEGVTE